MTYRYDDRYVDEHEPEQPPERRLGLLFVVVVGLAIVGVGSAFLWRGYGTNILAFPTYEFAKSSTAETADKGPPAEAADKGPPAETIDKDAGLRALQTLEQQSAGKLQTAIELLNSQEAEIKKLSEQLIALSGKVDALQHSVIAAQVPPPVVLPPVVPKPVAPRKKPVTLNPVGAAPNSPPRAAPVPITPVPNRP